MLAIAGFAATYFSATTHSLEKNSKPELAWLKEQYQLNDEQYARVCELYAAYHPKCLEMCREIDAENARLKILLASTNVVTPEIKQALADTSQLRNKCQANMLNHFYQVSQVMPPDEGKRYLAWMQKETLIPAPMSENQTTK
ncbi:MAG TPA: periplasmic heavy metal sensor [Methylomirabilota bacterium]|nr:periplasmic heavy metal sensor [Methylomirabilota bacterium]